MTMLLYHKNSLWIKENEDERQKIDSKMNYIFRHSISLKHAKDIRFFSLPLMLKKEYENLNIQRKNWLAKESKKTFKIKFVDRTLSFIKVISLYYIIFKKSYIGVDRAIVLIGLMSGMSEWLKNIFDSIIFLDNNSINVSNTREMLNLKPKIFSNKSLDYKEFTTPTIEFKNVSYSFMETGVQIFKDFNLKILPGEKIAIVGDNGAGKTTLIKLLLGLYKPTKGKILFDGQDIQKISKEQLFKKLCAVFQDFNFFASSIAENISCSSKYNYEKLSIILDQVDLSNRISSLPNGIFTEMTKEISKDGILLSGGESQKLLMARCLYKDSPIVILDEPTAALDAIAENKLYEIYSKLFEGKTIIFISHRLSSTKFCDRIILLEDGVILEEGTHDDLVARNGKYNKMYKIQSSYYRQKE